MTTVYDDIEEPGTILGEGLRVVVYLVASAEDSAIGGEVTGSSITIYDKTTKYADADGHVEFDLTPNADIDPTGTYYVWETHLRDGRVARRSIVVAADGSPVWVGSISIDPPSVPGLLSGTWDAMQLVSPAVPNRIFRTTDQGIPYQSDGAAWIRAIGLPADVWVTDMGALPSDDPADGTRNAAASAAAYAEARTDIVSAFGGFQQRRNVVIWPGTEVGAIYHVDDGSNIEQCVTRGVGVGVLVNLFDWSHKPVIIGTAMATGAPLYVDRQIADGGIHKHAVIENLIVFGHENAITGINTLGAGDISGLVLLDVDLYCDAVATDNNATLLTDGFFWLHWFRGSGRIGSGATGGKRVVKMRASNNGTRTCYLHQYRDLVFTYGNFEYDWTETTPGGPTGDQIQIHNVLIEAMKATDPFVVITQGAGASPGVMGNWEISFSSRADAVGAGSCSFIEVVNPDPGTLVTFTSLFLHNNACYTNYVLKANNANIGDIRAFSNNNVAQVNFLDPSSAGIGFGSSYIQHVGAGDHYDAGTYNSALNAASGGDRWFRYGGATPTNAWFGIDSLNRKLRFGPDTGAVDTVIERAGVGAMTVPFKRVNGHNPTDADFLVAPPDGAIALRTDGPANQKLWIRDGGGWSQ